MWIAENKAGTQASSLVPRSLARPLVRGDNGSSQVQRTQLSERERTDDVRVVCDESYTGGCARVVDDARCRFSRLLGHVSLVLVRSKRELHSCRKLCKSWMSVGTALMCFVAVCVLLSLVAVERTALSGFEVSPTEKAEAFPPLSGSLLVGLSVLVQHDTVAKRLGLTGMPSTSTAGHEARVARAQLPSWSLRVVDRDCVACFDNVTYEAALAGETPGGHTGVDAEGFAVYATTSAPLGLIGPMLLAMASVTDDVDAVAELKLWSWVGRSYVTGVPRGAERTLPRHLIVMGIPSTDQATRLPLRDAQRATWLTYREVARNENDFTGALLPLYVFAAAESDRYNETHGVVDMSLVAPTVGEYVAASAQRLAARLGADAGADEYSERRVVLREGWRSASARDADWTEPPCVSVRTGVVRAAASAGARSSLEQLSSALSLPVVPAFTAASQFVCHASTALWQEALTHRNVVWIDMMTDRRPTTNKKIGMSMSWGLPVEVGMSQKLILWLNYAYTSFPDVPYIMKGDDDTYLKVPQYLSDLRHMRGGWEKPRDLTATVPHASLVPDTAPIEDTEECLYRVYKIYKNGCVYGSGAGFALDRRLIQRSVNLFDGSNSLLLHAVTRPFNASWERVYLDLLIHREDMLMGKQVQEHWSAAAEVCPRRRVCYMSEKKARFHSIQRPRSRPLTWVSTVMHVGTPAVPYYVHYYFKNEHRVAQQSRRRRLLCRGSAVEKNATEAMRAWVASQVPATLAGYGVLPDVKWVCGRARPAYVIAEGDDVAVYDVRYRLSTLEEVECVFWSAGSD